MWRFRTRTGYTPSLSLAPSLSLSLSQVDVKLPGKGNSNSHRARPVHLIITMIKWTRTSRLSIKNSLSDFPVHNEEKDPIPLPSSLMSGPQNGQFFKLPPFLKLTNRNPKPGPSRRRRPFFFFFITLKPRIE